MHILIILPRWVGDVIMCTPMLRAVRRHFPDAKITATMRPGHASLLEGTAWIDEVVPYERRSDDPAAGIVAVARRLRGQRIDAALVVPNSLSSAMLGWMAGARRRIGFARNMRSLLLTDRLRLPWKGWHVEPTSTATCAMELAKRLGVPDEPLALELTTTDAERRQAEQALRGLFGDRQGPLVVLNDNCATGTSRTWGTAPFASLARRLVDRFGDARVLVHCGPGDREEARQIVASAGLPGVRGMHDMPELPFGLAKAIIQQASLMVTSDSGPRHMAAAFRVPTVVLLGPTDSRLGWSDHARLVEMRLELACSPCGRKECPLGHHDCMRLLPVDDVFVASARLLEENPGRRGFHGAVTA